VLPIKYLIKRYMSGTAEGRDFKFCILVGHVKY